MIINREQFRLQMNRMIDTFGDRYFPEQRELMIWECVEGLPYYTVIRLVDKFIRGAKHAPLPQDFSEAVASEMRAGGVRRLTLGDIHPREMSQCWDCADSGFIRLLRNSEHEDWATWPAGSAPCHCSRGRDLIAKAKFKNYELGAQFCEHWKQSYTIVPAYTEGQNFPYGTEPLGET